MVIMASGPNLHQPAINFVEMPSPSVSIVSSQHHSTETGGSHHPNTTGCLGCATALCNPATELFPDPDKWTGTPFREAAWLCGVPYFLLELGNKMSLIRLIAIVSCTRKLKGSCTCLCLPPLPSRLIPVQFLPLSFSGWSRNTCTSQVFSGFLFVSQKHCRCHCENTGNSRHSSLLTAAKALPTAGAFVF